MTGAVRIEPARVTVGGLAAAAEIRLGGTPRGAAIVVHDDPQRTVDVVGVMNHLAAHGYESIAVAVAGEGDAASTTDSTARILAAAAHIGERGHDNASIGLLGAGAGGQAVLRVSVAERFGAAVSVSPIDGLTEAAATDWLRHAAEGGACTPWLGLFTVLDDGELADRIDGFTATLRRTSPAFVQTVTYRHVEPDFYRNLVDSLAHAASFDAWQRVVEWFNLQVVPPLTPAARASLDRVATAREHPEEEE